VTSFASDQLEREIATALAALRAGQERPYYDAASDADAQARYYAAIDPASAPAELARALSALLEATHTPRPAYKPVVHLYPWVDLHPSRMLRSVYSGVDLDPEQLIRADAAIELRRRERLHALLVSESALGPACVRGRVRRARGRDAVQL
jgi:hypothetical protein